MAGQRSRAVGPRSVRQPLGWSCLASCLSELRVCIVDADGDMRRSIHEELNKFGLNQIRECANPEMALVLLKDFPADICVIDSMHGHADVLDMIQQIRTGPDSRNPELAIIMLTDRTNTEFVVAARNAGVDEFLAKPIASRALYARLLSIVEHPRVFVRSPSYTGPDRRYQDRAFVGRERRRHDDVDASEVEMADAGAKKALGNGSS